MNRIGVIDPEERLADDPAQRLPWILALALLLVLLALTGFGSLLHVPARQPARPRPLEARIYELPPSRGAAAANSGAVAGSQARHAAPAAAPKAAPKAVPKLAPKPATKPAPKAPPVPRRARGAAPRVRRSAALPPRASPRPAPVRAAPVPRPRRTIDWSALQAQIAAAVGQGPASGSALPQPHDPHTLVARYYLASVLSKLQRIGDMNYPTNLRGVAVVELRVASDGSLLGLKLLRPSGNPTLDRDALAIAREAAPFAPFPERLLHRTSHIKLICYMHFDGYRHIDPIY